MHKILFFVFLIGTFVLGQNNRTPVRHDAVTEAWLSGNLNQCYKLLQQSYKQFPDSFMLAYNLGYIDYLNNKSSQALKFFNEVKKLEPNFVYNNLMIARIYNNAKNYNSATAELSGALENESENYDLKLELARVHAKNNNSNEAIQIYSELIDEFEDEGVPKTELASIYRAQKEPEKALNLLDFGEDEFPESITVLEKYKSFRDLKKNGEAKLSLINLLSTYPNSPNFLNYKDTLKLKYGIDNPIPQKFVKYNYELDPKEKLDYLVEYGFITLGWMKVRLEKEMMINGKKVYHIVFYIDSNPSFDFLISLHPIYESFIDAETLSAVRSRLYTPDGEETLVRMYYFIYDKNEFKSYSVKNDGRYEFVKKDLPNAAQDGTSMLYLARGLVSNKTSGTTVVVIREKYKYAVIKYLDEIEEVEVKDKDVDALKIFAQAKFSGVAGMNGDAYGWFSMDKRSVPLEGKIEILLGSITVRVDDESQ